MKKVLIITLAFALVLGNGFMMFEGVMASAATVTDNMTHTGTISLPYNVELTVDPEMALTCDTSTVTMTGTINGMTGGTAGPDSRACTVKTNNALGYTMQAAVTGMKDVLTGDHTFTSYSGATSSWAAVGSGNNGFGYHSVLTGWVGGTGTVTIGTSAVHTNVNGTADSVTVQYEAEVGASSVWPSGLYQATTTISLYMN